MDGNLGEGGELGGIEAEATSSDGVAQTIDVGGANCGLGEGKFEVVLPQACEKCSNVGGVGDRGGVVDAE